MALSLASQWLNGRKNTKAKIYYYCFAKREMVTCKFIVRKSKKKIF